MMLWLSRKLHPHRGIHTNFQEDEDARVPFAVIGIFLIFISTLVSINLTRLDIKMAKTMSSSIEVAAPDTALQYARADIARAINYAGLEALKQIGETPVIRPDNNIEYYNGTNGDPYEFNKNRARAIINHTLNQYIESNYMYDTFVYDEFSVNVDSLDSWDKITMQPIKMNLSRQLNPPILKPGEGEYGKGYETYWKVSVPLKLHLKDLNTKSELISKNITVETVITSRYPILKDLTDEYSERLNGSNATMVETTAFAMSYTWARGYLQYAKGTPLNIVNNTHLSLIMNGALLLDQGFVFNSVDPMSLVEYANQTAITLSGKNKNYQDISLDGGSLRIDPQKDAFSSTDDPQQAKGEFDNAAKFDYNATPVTDFLNNDSAPGGSIVNAQIRTVIPQVYTASLATGVERQISETQGAHDGYESSYRVDDWGEPDSMRQIGIISNDTDVPGNLYGEKWEVTWTRNHIWRHYYVVYYSCKKTRTYSCTKNGKPSTCTEQYTGTCSRTEYNEMTTTDTRVDVVTITLKAKENSNTNILLKFTGTALSSKNDVENAYVSRDVKYRSSHTDPDLEDAYLRYKNKIFDLNKESNIKNQGLSGDNIRPQTYSVNVPGWVSIEAHNAVDDITADIRNDVHLDPGINYVTYPIPSELLNAAREDLIRKIQANESRYVNKTDYINNSKYNIASAKIISLVREWYVDEVKYQIQEKFRAGSDQVNEEIKTKFTEPEKIKQANRDATQFLSKGMNLPLGLTMKAYHVDENGTAYPDDDLNAWNESVTLSINQEPNYLDEINPYPANPRLYTLKVRNNNLLGGIGLHVLPSLNPWITTINMWSIDVEGEFVKFEVQDVDNEAHPNPIFGHEAQVYVREKMPVLDSLTQLPIGDNLPIKFSFITGTFIAVPPGKLTGVGDKNWVIIEESEGYKVKV